MLANAANPKLEQPKNATPSHRVLDIVPYARREMFQPEARKGRHFSLLSMKSTPLPRYGITRKGPVWKTLHLFGSAIIILFFVMTTISSFGLPYWYYCCYRLRPPYPKEQEASVTLTQQQSILKQWFLTLKRLRSQWKSISTLSVGVLPVILPMLSAYSVQRCSWSFLLSAMALLSGLTTLVITSLYRCHSATFRHEGASRAWREASLSGCGTPLAKCFWVLVSLPTVWLLYLMIALVTSIILIVWEHASPEKVFDDLCLPWHVNIFRATLLTLICTASAHFIFIISVLLFLFE